MARASRAAWPEMDSPPSGGPYRSHSLDSPEGTLMQKTRAAHKQEAATILTNQLMGNLAGDAQLQQDLRHPAVLRAINHWTGRERLSSEVPFELDPSRSSPVADPAWRRVGCQRPDGQRLGGVSAPHCADLAQTAVPPRSMSTRRNASPHR